MNNLPLEISKDEAVVKKDSPTTKTEKNKPDNYDSAQKDNKDVVDNVFDVFNKAIKGVDKVGQKTFGKGLVQSVRGLSDGSGMTVTIAKYLTPSGRDIHKFGIQPNITAKLTEDDAKKFISFKSNLVIT